MNSYKDRKHYLQLMWEIHKRLETIKSLNQGKSDSLYVQCTIESEALQIRKILELIAYASLLSHKEAYKIVRQDISKDWHAKRIIKKIEELNPAFYPVPIKVTSNKKWNRLRGGFLTKIQFASLYDQSANILHSKNPFSKTPQRAISFHKNIPSYILKIENLLSEHLIHLANRNELLHVSISFYENKPMVARFLTK